MTGNPTRQGTWAATEAIRETQVDGAGLVIQVQ